MTLHKNTVFAELRVGMEAEIRHLCRAEDFYVFANASGNMNPMHLAKEDGDGDGIPEALAPAMWLGALISAVLGNLLPGPGTRYKSQSLDFPGQAHAGDTVVAAVRLISKGTDREAVFDAWVAHDDGRRIAEGRVVVIAPERSVQVDPRNVPGLTLRTHAQFDRILEAAERYEPTPTAVVAPEDDVSLGGALLAQRHRLLRPILVGNQARIRDVAVQIGAALDDVEIVDIPDHAGAAAHAVRMVREGRADAVMKGNLHTDVLLRAVLNRDSGLRANRRLSHVFVMDLPGRDGLLMVTDAAINIAPTLEHKVDIIQNAIDLAHALGIARPKVGVLSAIETVNARIPSTLDAAILSKMADRGQITGGLVDGPLAMDNAVDLEAARTKGINSAVAGQADILVAPNLETGNMLAKQLTFLAYAQTGGIVMGALCPIILTSRADDERARLASCAIAVHLREWMRRE